MHGEEVEVSERYDAMERATELAAELGWDEEMRERVAAALQLAYEAGWDEGTDPDNTVLK